MKIRAPWYIVAPTLLIASGFVMGFGAVAQQQNDGEVLTRGPIHEAYANVGPAEREATQVVSRRPPTAIDELPPDEKPAGDNVTWIGGYWAWDDGYDDFIWVSGVWRDIPPDRQWIPGYWSDAAGGYQYVPGYWDEINRRTSDYLPAPPERIDYGPTSPSPGGSYVWAPGCWRWVDRSYYWQPGYWVLTQPNWIWTPSYYSYTPRGYVFIGGYWDYDLPQRGVCYAPVYYRQPYYMHTGYYYTPRLAIDINIAIGHFFVRPRSCHYYFGDYYGDRYRRRGYDPWYSVHERRDRYYHYDPIFVNYRERELRRDRDWDRHMEERYEFRREHSDARPPRTLVATEQIEQRKMPRTIDRNDLVLAKPAEQVIERERERPMTKIDMQDRRQLQARSREVEEFRTERRQIESQPRQTENAPETVNRTRTARGPERATVKTPTRTPPQQPARPQTTREDQQREQQQQTRASQQRTPQAQPQPAPTPERAQQPQREQQPQAPQVERSQGQPERRELRQSPVAARPDKSARQAPKKPDIPEPSARAPQAKEQQAQPEQRSGKGKGVGKQDDRENGRPR